MITLETLAQATSQQVFDQVAHHLLTQNEKSQIPNDDQDINTFWCAYRSPEGLKCAAGCLMSDEEYRLVEDRNMKSSPWETLVAEEIAPYEHHTLVVELQYVHDCSPVEEWKSRLEKLGTSLDLDINVLKEFE